MTEETRNALVMELKDIPIEEVRKYIPKTGEIPDSLRSIGVETLFDLYCTNIEAIEVPKGYAMKKSLALQKKFRSLPDETIQDIIFWKTKRVLPSNYNPDRPLIENLQMVLDELYWYLLECKKRESHIFHDTGQEDRVGRKRVSDLEIAIRGCYYEGESRLAIGKKLGFTNAERPRQILKDELFTPLFEGKQVEKCQQVFRNISINKDLIKSTKEYIDANLFGITSFEVDKFCQDVLKLDVIDIPYGFKKSMVVPAREKGMYESLITPFFEEMTSIIKPTQAEDIIERIGANKKVQKDILGKGKVYDNNFLYALLYCEELTVVSEEGILIRYEFIQNSKGSIHQEKALARIIADAEEPLKKEEVVAEYAKRYGEHIEKVNLATTEKYGCRPHAGGKTYWEYGGEIRPIREWIETYSQTNNTFYFDDIYKAVSKAGYIVRTNTLRTYVTNICAVDCRDKNHFCYKDYTDKYTDYTWRNPVRHGIINWLAKELHVKFEEDSVDELHISTINEYLFERSKNTEYQVENIYDHATLIQNSSLTSEDDSPFIIVSKDRGDWCLRKNVVTYDSINWDNFGRKGRKYEQKLLASATNIVRKAAYFKMNLMDLVDRIVEDEAVDNLERMQIRKKLIAFISESDIPHLLKLNTTPKGLLEVSVDAGKIIQTKQYKPEDDTLKIKYASISQLKKYNWSELRPVLHKELAFCSNWLKWERLISYEEAVEKFISVLEHAANKNLNYIVPQKLYEFFFVSNPTSEDRYCIMCSIAKNFEALLREIYNLTHEGQIDRTKGLKDAAEKCGFEDFAKILHPDTSWSQLNLGYDRALKYLQNVRNADSHGNWYIDTYIGDRRSELEKNIEKIRHFTALYIFAVAKYLVG